MLNRRIIILKQMSNCKSKKKVSGRLFNRGVIHYNFVNYGWSVL